MKQELKNKFPKWCFDNQSHATVLTDDLDSLVGCAIENEVNNNHINYFYNFDNVYKLNQDNHLSSLGIDLALTYGKCWDNHVTRIHKNSVVNPKSANMNSVLNVSGSNYYEKYSMSTAVLMWSFYGLPLPESRLGKMLLLCIDSGFAGHYNNKFKDIHTYYIKQLGFPELIDLLNNTSINEFFELQRQYKLKKDINIDQNGYLHTELPIMTLSKALNLQLDLPSQPFTLQKEYKSHNSFVKSSEPNSFKKNVISFALTGKKKYKYTMKV